MKKSSRLALIILDGWAHGKKDPTVNAIEKAHTPFVDSLEGRYPKSELKTSGEDVGLPEGQMGNSEVGHLNIGAGRIVYQPLVKITKAFESGNMDQDKILLDALHYARKNNKRIHLLGLLSDGGVHSHIDHVKELCRIFSKHKFHEVFVHAFMDGRDTDPKSGTGYVESLEQSMKKTTGKIASIIGRYYAMDRDKRWERIKQAYDLLVHGSGKAFHNAAEAVIDSYREGVTDEFIKPRVIIDHHDQPFGTIRDGDVILFFNFRTDRGRQLTLALSQRSFPEQNMKPLDLYYITFTEYDKTFRGIRILFKDQPVSGTLGEIIAKYNGKQLRIAETEKYPHVSYFFSGGLEKPFEGEKRKLIPSPRVATYDLQPEMSAPEVTEATCRYIEKREHNLIVLNFANPDMVGHTGEFDAIVQAVETIDECARKVVNSCVENGYQCLVTADHGNADFAVNDDGSPNTAHTTNPVPLIYVSPLSENVKLKNGRLSDIAPTILALLNVETPKVMTGEILIEY